jgi:hypothetical protein
MTFEHLSPGSPEIDEVRRIAATVGRRDPQALPCGGLDAALNELLRCNMNCAKLFKAQGERRCRLSQR